MGIQLFRSYAPDYEFTIKDVEDIAISPQTKWEYKTSEEMSNSHSKKPLDHTEIVAIGDVTDSKNQGLGQIQEQVLQTESIDRTIWFFKYPISITAIEALQAIEMYELKAGFVIPSTLVTQILATDYGMKNNGQLVWWEAPLKFAYIDKMQQAKAPAFYSPADMVKMNFLSRKEINASAEEYICQIIDGGDGAKAYPVFSTDRARFWLAVARLLWNENVVKSISEVRLSEQTKDSLHMLATSKMILDREQLPLSVAGVKMSLSGLCCIDGMYRQLVEMEANDMPSEGVRSLFPSGHLNYEKPIMNGVGKSEDVEAELPMQRAKDFATAILAEADSQAVFDLSGSASRIRIPSSTILSRHWGVTEVSLYVKSREEIWVTVKDSLYTGETILWRPYATKPIGTYLISEIAAVYLHLHLAGLWHDLRTAGEKALIPESRRSRQKSKADDRCQLDDDVSHARALPRNKNKVEHLSLSGNYQWGSEEERTETTRVRHFVDGFTRYLPSNWKASEKQKDLARERGVILLPGETFVKPHFRGKQKMNDESDGNSELPPPKKYYARGLIRLLTLPKSTVI